MPTCPTCNAEMRLVPAGVSKTTGRAYNAFYSCPNRCPKPQRTYAAAPKPNFEKVMEMKNDNIRTAQLHKEQGIKVAGAKSIAGEIVAAMIHVGELKGSDWFIKYKEIAEKVYTWEPYGTPTQDEIVNVPFNE